MGGARGYPQKNDASAPSTKFMMKSSQCPTSNNGDQLILASQDTSRCLIKLASCGASDYQPDANGAKTDALGKWVPEQVFELQAFCRFPEAALSGKYKKPIQILGPTEDVTKSDLPLVYPNIEGSQSLAILSMSQLGSVDHSDIMVVCDLMVSVLNSISQSSAA